MNITVNGKETSVSDNPSVPTLLAELDVKMPEMVTVELNGNILDRKTFGETTVHAGDRVEFLYFMGGGQARKL